MDINCCRVMRDQSETDDSISDAKLTGQPYCNNNSIPMIRHFLSNVNPAIHSRIPCSSPPPPSLPPLCECLYVRRWDLTLVIVAMTPVLAVVGAGVAIIGSRCAGWCGRVGVRAVWEAGRQGWVGEGKGAVRRG